MSNPAQMYHEYFVPAMFAPWARHLLEHARPQAGERVLDLACGTGVVTRLLASAVGAGGQVVGLDVSAPMLEVARQQPPPQGAAIEWLEGSAQALPEREFDLLLCQQGLQFFPDAPGAVQQMRRVLGNQGRAVLSVWQDLDTQPVFKALIEAEARQLQVPVERVALPFTFERRHALQPLFAEAGFSQVEIRDDVLEVTFPQPARFIRLTVTAAAAVIPELAGMSDDERARLAEAVTQDVEPVLQRHTHGDAISFPMACRTVLARA
jgi:ubiquinone/menaquinone biosynthesis C-methylase UbiE